MTRYLWAGKYFIERMKNGWWRIGETGYKTFRTIPPKKIKTFMKPIRRHPERT